MASAEPSSQEQVLRAVVRRLREVAEVPLAYGGHVEGAGSGFAITELYGTHTGSMQGLQIAPGEGLGGKALALGKPTIVQDYHAAEGITHAYDQAVAPERLKAVVAIPLRVGARPRAMLYMADRRPAPWGQSFLQRVMPVVASAERDLAIEDEVRNRLSTATAAATGRELTELYAELCTIASTVTDYDARSKLSALCDRFAMFVPGERGPGAAEEDIALAPREAEVLGEVGKGGSNAEIAAYLGLRVSTVKSYLQSAMRKLDAVNRGHAVYRARQLRLIP